MTAVDTSHIRTVLARHLETGAIDGCSIRLRGLNVVVALHYEGYQVDVEVASWMLVSAYRPDTIVSELIGRAVEMLHRTAGPV